MAQIRERVTKSGKKSYLVRIRIKGFDEVTATFSRKTDATRWAQEEEVKMRSGRYLSVAEASRHTLSDAIRRYCDQVLIHNEKTLENYRHHLGFWRERIGNKLLSEVTTPLIAQLRDELKSEVTVRGKLRSSGTVNRYLAALSAVLSTASNEWQWIELNPVRKVKKFTEPKGRVRFLSDDERESLLDACRNSDSRGLYLAVIIALSTGARRMEVWGLKWSDVDLKKGILYFKDTKNKETRSVPIEGVTLELLRDFSRVRRIDTERIFPSKTNPENPFDFRSPFLKALKEAQVDDFTWHDLRHSCASYLVMNGVQLRTVAEILGHKTFQMVMRYSHLSPDHLKDAISGMNRTIFK
jgi:integrase